MSSSPHPAVTRLRRVKQNLHPSEEAAPHLGLMRRQHLEATAQCDVRGLQLLDAVELKTAEQVLGKHRIGTDVVKRQLHESSDVMQIGLARNGQVDDDPCMLAAAIGHDGDQAVGNEMQAAIVVTQANVLQSHTFYHPDLARHVNEIALADLVTSTLGDDAYALVTDQQGLMASVSLEGPKVTLVNR